MYTCFLQQQRRTKNASLKKKKRHGKGRVKKNRGRVEGERERESHNAAKSRQKNRKDEFRSIKKEKVFSLKSKHTRTTLPKMQPARCDLFFFFSKALCVEDSNNTGADAFVDRKKKKKEKKRNEEKQWPSWRASKTAKQYNMSLHPSFSFLLTSV